MIVPENSPANKNMLIVDDKKTLELFQLMLFRSLLISLEYIFTSAMGSVLIKLQAFTLNGMAKPAFTFRL